MDSGNQWIVLSADNEILSIGHAAPGMPSSTIKGVKVLEEYAGPYSELSFGSYVEIPNIEYDAVGHKAGYSSIVFKLPSAEELLSSIENAEELSF